jgi:hypothetical protein
VKVGFALVVSVFGLVVGICIVLCAASASSSEMCIGLIVTAGCRSVRVGGRGLGGVTGNDGAVRRGRGGGMVVHHRWG